MASVSVNPPKTPITKGSNGIATATLPNVCKMPGPPAPFVPTPLPNIGQSGKQPDGYSTSVKVEGQPVAIAGASFGSSGDIASKGTGGGIVSNNAEGPTKFIAPGSLNVQIEGKNVQQLSDQMMNNCGPSGSPANAATMLGTIQEVSLTVVSGSAETCPTCKAASGETKSDAKPYDEFFSESERAELDAIGAANPDLVSMLPPSGGRFSVKSGAKAKAARDRFEKAKKASGMAGSPSKPREFHHPHPIKAGGCPIHQKLVEKPDEQPEKSRVDAVDNQIQDVVNRAIARNA